MRDIFHDGDVPLAANTLEFIHNLLLIWYAEVLDDVNAFYMLIQFARKVFHIDAEIAVYAIEAVLHMWRFNRHNDRKAQITMDCILDSVD